MNRSLTLFDEVNKLFNDNFFERSALGWDRSYNNLSKFINGVQEQAGNYPPFNWVKLDDNKYLLELAVAGFDKSEIEIELKEGNILKISGKTETDQEENDQYLHRGIGLRAFTRQWSLADSLEITNAAMANGMLRIWLDAFAAPNKKIPIQDEGKKKLTGKVST